MKRQSSEWEKIIANQTTDKGLIFKISNLYSSISEKQSNQKMSRRPKHFSKEDIQMANKHMTRCSTSLIIRKTQIKTTMRYQVTPFQMVITKEFTNNKGWR